MVNKCNAKGCFTNFPGHDSGAVFSLPKDDRLRENWLKFIKRKEIESCKYTFICEKHFEDRFLNKTGNLIRLIMKLDPVPTILSDSQKNLPIYNQPK